MAQKGDHGDDDDDDIKVQNCFNKRLSGRFNLQTNLSLGVSKQLASKQLFNSQLRKKVKLATFLQAGNFRDKYDMESKYNGMETCIH